MSSPDPSRLGGLGWVRSTKGALTRAERRHLLGRIVRGEGDYLATRIRRTTGRVPEGARNLSFDDFSPPDSKLARLAEEAAEEQSPHVKGHGYRTWAFGTALAVLDRNRLDREAFYLAALLHDWGIDEVVPGEDFVIRSAARAEQCVAQAGLDVAVAATVGDAIAVHCTAGITVEDDGAEGFYVNAGAGLDLAALRVGDLPRTYYDAVHAVHPRAGATDAFRGLITAESKANPQGRFAQLRRNGFNLLLRVNPLDR
ncbi:MAG TPA: HD domain-containing protein [Nocardioidaceae bacterium]|nr:HD domain-containing protein [Nocardioidaceae bacterium]